MTALIIAGLVGLGWIFWSGRWNDKRDYLARQGKSLRLPSDAPYINPDVAVSGDEDVK